MRAKSGAVARGAAVLLFVPVVLMAGCQKQSNNAQAPRQNAQAAHETLPGGGGRQRLRAVCGDDIQKYCANADRLRRCLRENIDKLSDACKTAVGQRGGRRARDNGGNDD